MVQPRKGKHLVVLTVVAPESRVLGLGVGKGLALLQPKEPEALPKLSKEMKSEVSSELFTVPSSFVGCKGHWCGLLGSF